MHPHVSSVKISKKSSYIERESSNRLRWRGREIYRAPNKRDWAISLFCGGAIAAVGLFLVGLNPVAGGLLLGVSAGLIFVRSYRYWRMNALRFQLEKALGGKKGAHRFLTATPDLWHTKNGKLEVDLQKLEEGTFQRATIVRGVNARGKTAFVLFKGIQQRQKNQEKKIIVIYRCAGHILGIDKERIYRDQTGEEWQVSFRSFMLGEEGEILEKLAEGEPSFKGYRLLSLAEREAGSESEGEEVDGEQKWRMG